MNSHGATRSLTRSGSLSLHKKAGYLTDDSTWHQPTSSDECQFLVGAVSKARGRGIFALAAADVSATGN
jgi:hypothetical protein